MDIILYCIREREREMKNIYYLFIFLVIVLILGCVWLKSKSGELFKYKKKYLIIRMLGNDLVGLHHPKQTLKNLTFTLEHEPDFPHTDKVFVLNRIFDVYKQRKIIKLLEKHNKKFIIIPFEYTVWDKINSNLNLDDLNKFLKTKNVKKLLNEGTNTSTREHFKAEQRIHNNCLQYLYLLQPYTLYICNNNKCRNFCIDYGKRHNYQWTFVCDSNSFFMTKYYKQIVDKISKARDYIIIPQIRLDDENMTNETILEDDPRIDKLPLQEPQIGFHLTSTARFNSKIPYGSSPKAELLRILNVPGEWQDWNVVPDARKIKDRDSIKSNYVVLSKVIRLTSRNKNNARKINWLLRPIGIYNTILQIRSKFFLENTNNLYYTNLNNLPKEYIQHIRTLAEKCYRNKQHNVTNKLSTPTGGTLHDYYSIPRYKSQDDCHINQNLTSDKYNKRHWMEFCHDTIVLALAYKINKIDKFGDRAASNLIKWFLDPDTKMTSHLDFAQYNNPDRSNHSGVIEFKDMFLLLDAIKMVSDRLEYSQQKQLHNWFKEYLQYLLKSKEKYARNNHLTAYYLQIIPLAHYTNNFKVLDEKIDKIPQLIHSQFSEDGRQLLELDRPDSFHYIIFNLQLLVSLLGVCSSINEKVVRSCLRNKKLKKGITKVVAYLHSPLDFKLEKMMYSEKSYKDRIVPLLYFARKHRLVKNTKKTRKYFSDSEVRRTAILNNDFATPFFWKLGI